MVVGELPCPNDQTVTVRGRVDGRFVPTPAIAQDGTWARAMAIGADNWFVMPVVLLKSDGSLASSPDPDATDRNGDDRDVDMGSPRAQMTSLPRRRNAPMRSADADDADEVTTNDVGTTGGQEDRHGRRAEEPTDIPGRGWKDIAVRTRNEVRNDRVPMLSAAVAFYALLALVPALVAAVSMYGLIADPSDVDRQVGSLLGSAPREVRDLFTSQLQSITENAGATVGLSIVIGIATALWSASSGMAHLVEATNIAYDEEEGRSWIRRRLLALVLTVGAVVFVMIAVGLIAVLPAALADTGLGATGRVLAGVARWVVLLAGMMLALSVLYRYAPDRDEPEWSWVSVGAAVATVLWLLASALFSVYTSNFGKYNETYGSLGVIVVVMLWLWITALVVLFGAELNAELERQTLHDTTTGPDVPLGQRDAVAADTLGETTDEASHG